MNESNDKESGRKPEVSKLWRVLVSVEKLIGFVVTFFFILFAFCIALFATCNAVGIQDDVDAAIYALPQGVGLTLIGLPVILIPAGLAWWEIYIRQPKKEKKDES